VVRRKPRKASVKYGLEELRNPMNKVTEKSIATFLIVSIVFVLLWVQTAGASSAKLTVSDTGDNQKCLKHTQANNPEVVTYSKTSPELETLIMNFLGNRSNPDLIDAALTNAGIVFCGQSEAEKFSRFLLKQLNSAKLPKRLMPMIEQYGRLSSLKTELDTLLASQEISEEYRNNLLKAKAAVEKPKNRRKNESTGR
jgi:hypothetical protein